MRFSSLFHAKIKKKGGFMLHQYELTDNKRIRIADLLLAETIMKQKHPPKNSRMILNEIIRREYNRNCVSYIIKCRKCLSRLEPLL